MSASNVSKPKRTVRSHYCGELRASHLGQEVMLCGWVGKRRDHGGVIFVDLRDRQGIAQVVFEPSPEDTNDEALKTGDKIRGEYVIWCKGKVRHRPDGMTNSKLPTGEIEVVCSEVVILSEAKTPPFTISQTEDEEIDVAETVRLKYR